ncbi:hypothetical protein P170DRAFT_467311 [Aspergillus steynii IBT 23096]|uniref:Uncharacterized protein n=1 Tax=Aspergillus steynii IBT 23096 TaxID=1392250 RepID=A0A2I2G001_9EURO|nr:uncharacterized protein P170DRAFT_467311 [Aspergillus steynii IBT 23096]PLB46194.1 hypothetical protein P170DRAFT_467311 [Aspergillus steynii IBT 23096]
MQVRRVLVESNKSLTKRFSELRGCIGTSQAKRYKTKPVHTMKHPTAHEVPLVSDLSPSSALYGHDCPLHPHEMRIMPMQNWHADLTTHKDQLHGWVVTKVEHMKNFHFSPYMHEFLRATVREEPVGNTADPIYLIIERETNADTVTVGWERVPHPELSAWWIERLLRGYFNPDTFDEDGLPVWENWKKWKAVGYSGSDFLCSIDFEGSGVSLLQFAEELLRLSESSPRYSALAANNYWFAFSVYEGLKDRWFRSEYRGDYYKHRGKFAGVHWGSPRLASAREYLWYVIMCLILVIAAVLFWRSYLQSS